MRGYWKNLNGLPTYIIVTHLIVVVVVVVVVVTDLVFVDEDEMSLSRRVWIVWSQDLLASNPVIPRGRGSAQEQVRKLGGDIVASGPRRRRQGVPHGPPHRRGS